MFELYWVTRRKTALALMEHERVLVEEDRHNSKYDNKESKSSIRRL